MFLCCFSIAPSHAPFRNVRLLSGRSRSQGSWCFTCGFDFPGFSRTFKARFVVRRRAIVNEQLLHNLLYTLRFNYVVYVNCISVKKEVI